MPNAGKKPWRKCPDRYPTDAVYHIVVDRDEVYWGVKNVCSDFLTVSPPAGRVRPAAAIAVRCASVAHPHLATNPAQDQLEINPSKERA